MNVLITGSSGYIGGVLAKMCKEQGHYVYGIDNSFPDPNRVTYVDHFIGGSYENLPQQIDKIDVIFHLAAHSLLGPSVRNPMMYFENNCSRMEKFLTNLAHKEWQGTLIFASSAAVYGASKKMAYKEYDKDFPLNPINPYGWTKLVGEQLLTNFHSQQQHPPKIVMFRFFNVAGSYGDVGQAPSEPHVLTRMMQALVRQEVFTINGKDYNTFDGTAIRDYVHVVDVARAMLLTAECLARDDQEIMEVYNLGSGRETSIQQLITLSNRITGVPLIANFGPRREGDPGYLVADPLKFKDEFEFEYLHNINSIIHDAYVWAVAQQR